MCVCVCVCVFLNTFSLLQESLCVELHFMFIQRFICFVKFCFVLLQFSWSSLGCIWRVLYLEVIGVGETYINKTNKHVR